MEGLMRRYDYYYAIIDLGIGMCRSIQDTTDYVDTIEYPEYIPIPEYNRAYLLKYYNRTNGKWYVDSAFTIEATELNG